MTATVVGALSLPQILGIYHQKYEDLQPVETDYKVDPTNLNIIAEILQVRKYLIKSLVSANYFPHCPDQWYVLNLFF